MTTISSSNTAASRITAGNGGHYPGLDNYSTGGSSDVVGDDVGDVVGSAETGSKKNGDIPDFLVFPE